MSRRPLQLASLPLPLVCAILALAIGVAWSSSLSAPFLLDDHHAIVDNPTISDLWSLRTLQPPATAGETVSGRPLLNFSFALNAAITGVSPTPFRVGNLLIHFAAALALFGITWRTLIKRDSGVVGPDLRAGRCPQMPAASPRWFALVVTLIWAVHPLQTGAVTYIVQRAESLAALFILLVVYCFIRYTIASGRARVGWSTACLASAVLGVATKETAAVAPLLVLLYDRAFVSHSFTTAWRSHRRLYLGLAASWVLLAVLVTANAGRGGSAGFGSDISPWTYALTQAHAVVHYIRLAVWPHPLVFDYGVVTASGIGDVWLQGMLLLAALGATIWALVRNHPSAFAAAAVFLLLAPSSSVIPVATQTIAEHRMYLALAPLVLLAGVLLHRLTQWVRAPALAPALSAAVILAFGITTFARNSVYRSDLTLWQDVVEKRPDNPRAHHNLGIALLKQNRLPEAVTAFNQAIELQPRHAFAHYQLGTIAVRRSDWEAAIKSLSAAVAAEPRNVTMRVDLGHALTRALRPAEAETHYRAALEIDPTAHDARSNLAGVVLAQGRLEEAETLLRQAIAGQPNLAIAHHQLGLVLEATGRRSAAEAEFKEAIRLQPTHAASVVALGNIAAEDGDLTTAEQQYRRAIDLDPADANAHFGLGNTLAQRRRFSEAKVAYSVALRLDPTHRRARHNLGNCQLVTRDFAAAVETYQEILRRHPEDATAAEHLKIAREFVQRVPATAPVSKDP